MKQAHAKEEGEERGAGEWVSGAGPRPRWRGSHPDSTSGGPGESWREARAKHDTDRKQIGPEPAAVNHRGGARPSQSSHTHTHKHVCMYGRK